MVVTGYKFADFYLNIPTKSLYRQQQTIELSERQFKLLLLLASASPESISKKRLAEQLWDEVIVSDWSLFRLISDTRQLLGDDGESQQIIKTSRGIGFCITQVEPSLADDAKSTLPTTKAPIMTRRSVLLVIAVLLCTMMAGWGWQQFKQQHLMAALTRIAHYQDNTYTAFKAQVARRDELSALLETRLNIKREQQFEKFFAHHFTELNQQELFVFKQIRGITESGLYKNNQAILEELNANPEIFTLIEKSHALQQHLTFWINKYHSVFEKREDMCLLYVGVEDGVPYPSGVDQQVQDWLKTKKG